MLEIQIYEPTENERVIAKELSWVYMGWAYTLGVPVAGEKPNETYYQDLRPIYPSVQVVEPGKYRIAVWWECEFFVNPRDAVKWLKQVYQRRLEDGFAFATRDEAVASMNLEIVFRNYHDTL